MGERGTRDRFVDERENKRWNVEDFDFSGIEGSGSWQRIVSGTFSKRSMSRDSLRI